MKIDVHSGSPLNLTLLEEWEEISVSECENLVEAYLKRPVAGFKAEGGAIKC